MEKMEIGGNKYFDAFAFFPRNLAFAHKTFALPRRNSVPLRNFAIARKELETFASERRGYRGNAKIFKRTQKHLQSNSSVTFKLFCLALMRPYQT